MLTFRELDDLPESIVSIMLETEQTIINDMARRIRELGYITDATEWQLSRLEALGAERDFIVRELAKASKLTDERLIELFDEAALRTLKTDDQIYKAAGYSPEQLADNTWLKSILQAGYNKTNGEFYNLTRTTANTATRQFEHALDIAHQQVASGAFTYQSSIKNGIRSLTERGIAAIRYPTGHVDYLDVAFRRATLTGVNQTAAEIQLARMKELGSDYVETTAHAGARPDHVKWQGKVFQLSGSGEYENFYDATGYGTGPGLCGWNCRHSFYPYFPEFSEPAYSYDMLREYNSATVKFNGEDLDLYDATQKQRAIERQIRGWKREASALESAGLDNRHAKNKVSEWQARQRDFIDQTGLKRDYFRERGGSQYGRTTNISSPPIERNRLAGNAGNVYMYDGALNKRQNSLLDGLQNTNDRVTIRKRAVSMNDLSALTAKTGVEYALFTKGQERMIIRGDATRVYVSPDMAERMARDGWRWSGHTHVGRGRTLRNASEGDRKILEAFGQSQSVILDAVGGFTIFDRE